MKHLLLWDIDGTLIHGGGIAGEALRAAMEQFFGPIPTTAFSYAGMTDQQILFETYPQIERATLREKLTDYTRVYLAELNARRDEYRARGGVQPGVRELLSRFQADPNVLQSLLTGNIRPAAQIKLEIFDLADYVDFEVGAYGSDHHHRPELVPFAVRRAAERYGREFRGADVVVIGDTPNDIACGKAADARTIGVATGSYDVAALQAAGADVALENLADIEAATQAILSSTT